MESGGGSEGGKPWTTSTIIENRGKWSLGADVELLRHLQSFSERISSQLETTSQALDSLEADLSTTCVGVHLVSNHFLSLADSQFVENRVYDDEDPVEDKQVSEPVKKSREQDEADRFSKKKSAIANGLDVLRASFTPVEIPNIDSDDDVDDDDDGAPIGIAYKPVNPFESRPLPHLIGSKEFLTDPYVGIKSRLTDDEEDDEDDDEENEEESSDKSSASKAFSVHEDSEPESDRVNIESGNVSEIKPDTLGRGELSFAEHLSARLEGMRVEGKLDTSSDDSLPSVAPVKIPTTIDTPYEPIVRPYDNKADRFYDNGFDDRYDDYDDSIFARNSTDPPPDNDFDEEDLFLPNDDRNLESPLWGRTHSVPNKQNLIRDLENKLKKDSNPPDLDKNNSSTSSSPPRNRAMNPASDLFSGDVNEEPDLFSVSKPVSEPVKKKMPAGAVSIFGSNVDPFKNNSKTEKDTTNRAPIKKKPDIVSSLKSNNSDNMDDDEDSLFSSGLEKTSSKNSSTKLSDSFHEDNLSIRSNKSGLFESDAIPPTSSTKAIDDLFKDIDEENDDDDLFSSYFTKTKKDKPSSAANISSSSKPKALVDDLFGDFKDDLFANVKDNSKTASTEKKSNVGSMKVSNLFSDSDSDSEFIPSKKSSSTAPVMPKQQLPSKSLFSDDDNDGQNDIFSVIQSSKSKNVVETGGDLKQGKTDELFGSSGKDTVKSVVEKDLFKDIDSKPKLVPPVKQSLTAAKNKISIFDDTDSDGDDGLFSISTNKKPPKPKPVDDDLFSQPNSKLSDKQGAQNTPSKLDDNLGDKSKPYLVDKDNNSQLTENPVADSNVPSQPLIYQKTVEDDLFGTNTNAKVEVKAAVPKFEDSKNDNIEDRKEEAVSAVVDDPLFDESFNIAASKDSKKYQLTNRKEEGVTAVVEDPLFDEGSNIAASKGSEKDEVTDRKVEVITDVVHDPLFDESSNVTASKYSKNDKLTNKQEEGTAIVDDPLFDEGFNITASKDSKNDELINKKEKAVTAVVDYPLFDESFNIAASKDRKKDKLTGRKEEVITDVVHDPLFDESFNKTASNISSIETKSDLVARSSADSLFGGIDDDSTDIFSSLGKPGSKSSKSNNEKTVSSVPSSNVTNKKEDDGLSVLKDDNDDGLFITGSSKTSNASVSQQSLIGGNSNEIMSEKKLFRENSRIDQKEKVDFHKKDKVISSEPKVGGIFVENQSEGLDFPPITKAQLSKTTEKSTVESDPLFSQQTTTAPNAPVKPQPLSKPSKPILPEKSSKPTPPRTLNLPDPILCDDRVSDVTDGGIISTESKVESPKKITPGKLNLQKTLNIDPRALLPGAQPKFKKPSNEDVEKIVSEPPQASVVPTLIGGGSLKPEPSENKVSPSGVLANVNKDRARIQAKRRPQTRKARREALRHSTFEEDETDNSSSVATQSVADQTSTSLEPSSVLSPSTDEEDLFGVPPLDLPPDYSKVSTSPGDLFAVPTTLLSPGLSIADNQLPVSDNSSKKPANKRTDDIFKESEDKLHSIPSAGFDDDPSEIDNNSKDDFYNSSAGLFDDDLVDNTSNFVIGGISDKKVHSNLKIPTETNPKSEDDENSDLFSIKPSRPKEETLDEDRDLFFDKPIENIQKNLETSSSKNLTETNKNHADPLASDLNFSKKVVVPTVLSDEEDLFSTVSLKKDKKVGEKSAVPGLTASSSETKDVGKKVAQSLFSNDDNDDLFQTANSAAPKLKSVNVDNDSKIKPTSSKAAVSSKINSASLFEDDDEDLFGGKPKTISSKQPPITKPSSENKLFADPVAKSKKSIFDDDNDDDSDIFSTSKASASKSVSKSVLKKPADSQPSKSTLSKTDSKSFIDPLSNLDK